MKLFLTSLFGLFLFTSTLAQATIPKNELEIFLIQTTKSASIQPIEGKKNQYQLTLKKVEPYVSYLSDRPKRVFGYMTIDEYMKLWTEGNNNFKNSPPNVSIETALPTKHNEKLTIMGDISKPNYDSKTATLTYVLTIPEGEASLKVKNLGYTIVFIDSIMVHWNPGGFGA